MGESKKCISHYSENTIKKKIKFPFWKPDFFYYTSNENTCGLAKKLFKCVKTFDKCNL